MSDHDHHEELIDRRIVDAAEDGCAESRLYINRRAFMGMSASLFSWAFMPRFADAATSDPRLLVVVLRGGMDGLHVAVPLHDPHYTSLRGGIAVDLSTTLPLDGQFGLNPVMPNLGRMFASGDASLIHAVAPPVRVRSHFECSDNLENGFPAQNHGSVSSGWMNRLLTVLPAGNRVKAQGALQVGLTPLILKGPEPVLSWSPDGFTGMPEAFDRSLLKYYQKADPEFHAALKRGMEMKAMAEQGGNNLPGGDDVLRRAFRGAARLLAQEAGPRIAVLSVEGWDTHFSQRVTLAKNFMGLDAGLEDFRQAIGQAWSQTAVICVTEFGRTARVNGSAGTDHGTGTVAFLLGGAITGGKVHGQWPGLGPTDLLDNRDIRATTDLRAVFKGLLADHLGVGVKTLDTLVFPESAAVKPMPGLISPAA